MGEQHPNLNAPTEKPPPPPRPVPTPPPGVSAGDSSGWRKYPNPPESGNPDPTTLRDQWRFAIRQYSRWYSQAWGTAILAGAAFFALGWYIKGSNPLPSKVIGHNNDEHPKPGPSDEGVKRVDRQKRISLSELGGGWRVDSRMYSRWEMEVLPGLDRPTIALMTLIVHARFLSSLLS